MRRHVSMVAAVLALAGSGPVAAQQNAASGTQTAPPSVTRPPLPNRLNEVMPAWLRVRGEFRERVEGFDNSGFVEDRDDMYYLSRLRLNATATGQHIAATVQVQDARVGGKTVGPTGAPFTATFDVRQAFMDVGAAGTHVTARLGRQEVAFGDQRLLGPSNWSNAARTFDAARVTVKTKALQVDLVGGSLVRILDGELDKSGAGNRLAGAYVSSGRVVPRATFEPYVFWRRDVNLPAETGPPSALSQTTTGVRLTGGWPAAFDYNVEMAAQAGSLGTDRVRAWAGHWMVRKSLAGPMSPHVGSEYNFASGDRDPVDGSRGTFDQLYPTAHDKYGLADQIGWRNIHDVRVGFDVSPLTATPVTVNYHHYWLAERKDALYATSGAAIARVAGGAAHRRVGQEVDIQIARPLTPQLALVAGYAHLFAGPFLKEATPGKSYSGPFAALTYVFLADK